MESNPSPIIVNPTNYSEMIEKLEAREKDALKEMLEKQNAPNEADLLSKAREAIKNRSLRASNQNEIPPDALPKALSSREIIENPESHEIQRLQKEMANIFNKSMQE
jgi:hypothetical protein